MKFSTKVHCATVITKLYTRASARASAPQQIQTLVWICCVIYFLSLQSNVKIWVISFLYAFSCVSSKANSDSDHFEIDFHNIFFLRKLNISELAWLWRWPTLGEPACAIWEMLWKYNLVCCFNLTVSFCVQENWGIEAWHAGWKWHSLFVRDWQPGKCLFIRQQPLYELRDWSGAQGLWLLTAGMNVPMAMWKPLNCFFSFHVI